MANTTLQVKKSGITGNVPDSLEYGELALNYADGKLYFRDVTDNISFISTDTTTDSFATINANSSLIFATSPTDTLSIAAGNNITISACTVTKTITINSSGDSGAGSGNSFGVITSEGYEDIVANTSNSRLTFYAQTGIAIGNDTANSTISIATNLIGASNVIIDYGRVADYLGVITFDYGYLI